ncbi:haloacid dehalogenase-like hydrolase domain-containing protein 2, partial [Dinothrombium tinctorium]
SAGLKVRFATNTTKESQCFLWSRLQTLGFNIAVDEIFTSLTCARQLVVEQNLKPYLLLEESAMDDFNKWVDVNIDPEKANAVVVGLAPSKFHYEYLNTAFRILQKGASLVAIHKGRYYRRKDGMALGPGPFVTALEYSSDVKSVVVGKPEATFFAKAIQPFACEPDEVVMIGDDVRDDIGGAQAIGMTGMLVKTGKYRNGDENKIDPKPDFIFENVVNAIDSVIKATS